MNEPKRELNQTAMIPRCLVVLAGPRFGETIALKKGENTVGSGASVTIQILTSLLSERHFTLVYDDQEVRLKAENGVTLVNTVPVEEKALKDGDLIGVDGILLRYVEQGSQRRFFVGDFFYGLQRRRYPRFNMIAAADAFLSGENIRLDILSVRDVGRGGVGLFCKEEVKPGLQITVSLYSKNADRMIVAESIHGAVASVARWSDALFLLNIRFHIPVSSEYQPLLCQRLTEMEDYFCDEGLTNQALSPS